MTKQWTKASIKQPVMNPDEEGFPKSEDVLVYFSDGAFSVAHCAIYDDTPEWFTEEDNVTKYVMYWMELPAPPLTEERLETILRKQSADDMAKRQALIAKGICPDCDGDGEQGGQFCGGYWKCQTCGGSGKAGEVIRSGT